MRVAFLHQPWSVVRPPFSAPDSVALLTGAFARQLATRCRVATYSRRGPGQPDSQIVDGVHYRTVSGDLDRYVKTALSGLGRLGLTDPRRPPFAWTAYYRHFLAQVTDDLRRWDPEIVHVHNFTQFLPPLRRALPRARLVLHMHCEWLTQLDPRVVRSRLRHADLILSPSESLSGKTRRAFPDLAARCRTVFNGVDTSRFAPARGQRGRNATSASPSAAPTSATDRPLRILFVGRLSPEKGVHDLLQAFTAAGADYPSATLRLVGPGAIIPFDMAIPFCRDSLLLALADWYRPGAYPVELRRLAAQVPAGRVEILDQGIPHDELPDCYREADLFVAPSVWEEPFGIPLVEAMASGLPVIATRGGAFPEIVKEGHTGLLVDRASPGQLAAALRRLLADAELRHRMGEAGRRRAEDHFTYPHVAEALLAEYEALLGGGGPAHPRSRGLTVGQGH